MTDKIRRVQVERSPSKEMIIVTVTWMDGSKLRPYYTTPAAAKRAVDKLKESYNQSPPVDVYDGIAWPIG